MILAEILATPVSAYLMTFDIAFPFVLGLVVIVIGFLPALTLPETLPIAKAKRSTQQNAASVSSGESTEFSGKHEVLREITRRLREFKDSTRFIWRNTNICLMIVIMFVSIMSRQSTFMLLQYASKKFNWSIAKVSPLRDRKDLSDRLSGQPPHITARCLFTHHLPRTVADRVLRGWPVFQSARQTQRLASQPGQRTSLHHRLRRNGTRTGSRPPHLGSCHSLPRLLIHDHHPQSCHVSRRAGSRWHPLLGHWSISSSWHLCCRPTFRVSVSFGNAPRRCMDGHAFLAGCVVLRGGYCGCLASPASAITILTE